MPVDLHRAQRPHGAPSQGRPRLFMRGYVGEDAMQCEPRHLGCSPRTDFSPLSARGRHSNRAASSGTCRLMHEQTRWQGRLSSRLFPKPILSLLTANRQASCLVDPTGTRRSSSASRFETCTHYPASAFWSGISSALLAQRAGARNGCVRCYPTDEYGADDGAA
jgi:hypothetical protein